MNRQSTEPRPRDRLATLISDAVRNAMSRSPESIVATLGDWVRKEVSADLLLKRLVDAIVVELEADRGTIFMVDPAREELVSVAAHLPELAEIRLPVGDGIAGSVAASGEAELVADVDRDERFRRDFDERTGYQTDSTIAAPLLNDRGQVLGVVQLLNRRDGRFTRTDLARLVAIADHAGELLIHTTVPEASLTEESVEPEDNFAIDGRFNGIVTESETMREVLRDVRKVASTEATVLLRGESGTGKGVIARALHNSSARSTGPFVAIDCTTLPEHLMENELFGHARGAFTGADTSRKGRVAAAEGGTLFLDEIGDLPAALQGKLLMLLQDRRYTPVGAIQPVEADVRVVAATHRPLEELVEEKSFREDLYYRLRVVELSLPPLRERGPEDIARLARFFISKSARRNGRTAPTLSRRALELLVRHDWPGNVRELENCIESAVIFADDTILGSDLSFPRRAGKPVETSPFAGQPTLQELERRYIVHLLELHDGNKSEVARVMGIGRTTLFRKLKSFETD